VDKWRALINCFSLKTTVGLNLGHCRTGSDATFSGLPLTIQSFSKSVSTEGAGAHLCKDGVEVRDGCGGGNVDGLLACGGHVKAEAALPLRVVEHKVHGLEDRHLAVHGHSQLLGDLPREGGSLNQDDQVEKCRFQSRSSRASFMTV
jgi:hypothetical protein